MSQIVSDLERQLAETRAVLNDLRQDADARFAAHIEARREELLEVLRNALVGRDSECSTCGQYGAHTRDCQLAEFLRIFGGEEERQRQADEAEEEATWTYVQERLKDHGVGTTMSTSYFTTVAMP